MSDYQAALERLMDGPLWDEIHACRDWARTVSTTDDFELFLNPADAKGLLGCSLLSMPVKQSQGVTPGSAVIYDVQRTRYIRQGQQPTDTP
jgi:hypothetical protein